MNYTNYLNNQDWILKNGTKNNSGNFGNALSHFIAQDSVNKFDKGIKVTGLKDAAHREILGDILWDSEFDKKLQKVGYKLSKGGLGKWGLVSWMINGKPYIDAVEVYNYKKIAGRLIEIYLNTDEVIINGEENYEVFDKFYLEGGKVFKQPFYLDSEEGMLPVNSERLQYPGTLIPVQILENNSLDEADIPQDLKEMLDLYDYFGEQLQFEWKAIKTKFLNNRIFGNNKDNAEWQKNLDGGDQVIDVNDPDGTLQNAFGTLISGSTTATLLLQNIGYLEDSILKYSFTMRETTSTGTNKGTLEVSGVNQAEFEYMISKLKHRTDQLKRFMLVLFNQLGWNDIKRRDFEVEIPASELEQFKIDNMKADVRVKQKQALQYAAVANKANAEAEVLKNPPATTEPTVKPEEV